MLYTIPDYYHEFSCIAGECEDTCCAGWQIVADEAALKKYKKVTGSFRKRLRKSINWKEGTFKQDKNKRCAFLNDENLCDMYIALGEKSLCRNCLICIDIDQIFGIAGKAREDRCSNFLCISGFTLI